MHGYVTVPVTYWSHGAIMATKLKSSITDEAARVFIRDADERDTLFCRKIPGLYLIRLKRGGSWRYRYTDDTGKRRTATIGKYPTLKPETAAAKAGEWIAEGKDPLKAKAETRESARKESQQSAARTLGRYLDGKYAKYQARRKTGAATIQRIKSNFPELLDRDMASLTATDIESWQERREAEGRQHNTLARSFTALKTALTVAVRQNVLGANPLQSVALEREPNDARAKAAQERRRSARRLLTDDELQWLHSGLEAFAEGIRAQRRNSRAHGKPDLPDFDTVEYPHWFIPFAHVALYTGMRPSDIYTLTWTEASVSFGRIDKIAEKTRHHPEPARIVMDMAEPLRDSLKRWHRQHGKPKAGLVFPSPVTGEQMDRAAHRRPWRRVKQLAGLADDLDFYALRHHFISTLVAAGVPLLTVAKLAGQKSATMIENHYGHLQPASASEAIAAFARSVGPKEKAGNA